MIIVPRTKLNFWFVSLPVIPQNLLDTLTVSAEHDPVQRTHANGFKTGRYNVHMLDPLVVEWLSDVLEIKHVRARVQVISSKGMNIHKDVGRTFALNYIIDPGGDNVLTHFYDQSKELIESIHIPSKTFHMLRTQVYHSVSGLDPDKQRIALSVSFDTKWAPKNLRYERRE